MSDDTKPLGSRRRLRTCKQDHGGQSNAASVYGHHGSARVCIRLRGTDTWIYDPAWEVAS